jgi:hypothetical protein
MQIFFHGFYVRSVQGLQNYLEKEKSPGWQWLYYRLRSLKKSSEVFIKKFKYMSARNQVIAPDISMAASVNDNKDPGTVGDAVSTSRANAIGTATHSRCPIRAL